MLLEKERHLMKKHIKEVGIAKLILTYLLILVIIVIIEVFASLNIYMIRQTDAGVPLLRETFSTIAILVAAFTIIANLVFTGGHSREDREFNYYFRTRPLILWSSTAIIGDIIAVFLVGRSGFAYIVFFTSLIALNLFAAGFAVYSVEKALKKNTSSGFIG